MKRIWGQSKKPNKKKLFKSLSRMYIIDRMEYIFYKIKCNDDNIKFVYVGSTKNIKDRKWAHKSSCYNENKPTTYNLKLYTTIRDNGGWDNWIMEPIGKGLFTTRLDARIEEQKYIKELEANLNTFNAVMTKEDEKRMKDEYVKNNHDKVLESKKIYRDKNKEILKAKYKENINLQNKRKEKTKCECGGSYTYCHKAEHIKSKKHCEFKNKMI